MVDWTLLPDWFVVSAFFLLGAILGSFANVVIYRLPAGESVVKPRSRCQSCKKPIAWYQNIPILSWIALRGQCAHCKIKVSWRYPVVELITAITFAGLYWVVGWQWILLEYMLFAFGLIVVSFIDFDHMILPDVFTLSGIVIGLVGAAINPERSMWGSIAGVLMGGGFLWAIAYIYLALRKEDGMGGGDIKLLAWIGAVLEWQAIPFVILASSVLGSVIGLVVAARTKDGLKASIPFGPYLALAALLYIFGGDEIGRWYLGLFLPAVGPVN